MWILRETEDVQGSNPKHTDLGITPPGKRNATRPGGLKNNDTSWGRKLLTLT
jgi:hypothetical protein